MATKATKDQKEQVKTLSYIDSLITILGDYPEDLSFASSMDVNPFGFLINIAKSLGIFNEFLNFISSLIQYELPLIELGIKGILLANIKELVSCSSDPFIPNYMRKQINSTNNSGITFSLSDLDYNSLMSIDPLSNGSEYSYLGIPRTYKATYAIYQQYSSSTVVNLQGSTYSTKEKCEAALEKKKSKCENKYVSDSKYKYEISAWTTTEVTKNSKQQDVTSYTPHVKVDAIAQQSLTSCYVKQTKEFDTYLDADAYITQMKRKFEKEYNEKKGCHIVRQIEPIIKISVYELARAKDFNAFLWFVCHMANFNKPILLNVGTTYETKWTTVEKNNWAKTLNNSIQNLNLYYEYDKEKISQKGPLGVLEFIASGKTESEADSANGVLGASFVLKDGSQSAMYDLCVKKEKIDNTHKKYTLVPATSDYYSLNWYGDRSKYFDFIKYWGNPKKEESKSPRNYENEIGICNIEFDTTINDTSQYSNFTRNQLRFTVLPKPFIHFPQLLDGTVVNPFKYKKILFNTLGQYDPKGKYSCFVVKDEKGNPKYTKFTEKDTTYYDCYHGYYLLATKDNGSNTNIKLCIPRNWSTNTILISENEKSIDTNTNSVPFSCLYECYPNLSIYEFNYDYVMSQRLLDPKVLVGQLIESILNAKMGMSGSFKASITHNVTEGTLRQVVIDMITGNTDAYTVNDCYNSFSNEKYNNLLNETELKKSQGYHFEGTDRTVSINMQKINEILSEYDNPDITQEGQVDVINRAFQEAIVSITAATDDKESWDIKFNIIQQIIQDLTFSIIEKLLTPKILMLIAVNKKLMGDDTEWTGNVLSNLTNILIGIIQDIVKQITDIILQKVLDFILGFLKPKISELAALITKEYTEQYRTTLEALIKACGTGWNTSAATASTQIDNVTYADIDPTKEITDDKTC